MMVSTKVTVRNGLKTNLGEAKCKPLTKKLKLINELLQTNCNDVTLHGNLLHRHAPVTVITI